MSTLPSAVLDLEHEDGKPRVALIGHTPDPVVHALMQAIGREHAIQLISVEPKTPMNPDTGKISVFEDASVLADEQAKRLADNKKPLIPLDQFPDPKCKKCYGRGRVGKDLKTGNFIPCKCVQKANKQTRVKGKQLTISW